MECYEPHFHHVAMIFSPELTLLLSTSTYWTPPHTLTNSPPPFLPWASRWPPRWPGWRCGRGGWRWTRRDWTGPRARATDSFLSWHWTLRRDHPFDWQPGDYLRNSCNRTGLPEREASHGKWAKERKEGQTDGRKVGSRRQVIKERHRGLRGTRGETDKKEEGKKTREQRGGVQKKKEEKAQIMDQRSRGHLLYQSHRRQRQKSNSNWERAQNAKFFDTEKNTRGRQARKHENVSRKKINDISITAMHDGRIQPDMLSFCLMCCMSWRFPASKHLTHSLSQLHTQRTKMASSQSVLSSMITDQLALTLSASDS